MLRHCLGTRRPLHAASVCASIRRRFTTRPSAVVDGHARVTLTSTQRALVERTDRGHVGVVGAYGSGKTTLAAERVLWLDAQRGRRVLTLTGTRDASLLKRLDHATTFYALERRGHRVASVREWTQHTLEELGVRSDRQRVLTFGQLTVFLMHHAHALPLRAFHQRLATASSLQLRRSVADMVRFFTTLEAYGVQPDAYTAYASTGDTDDAHVELAHAYGVYRALQQRHDVRSWDGLVLDLHHVLCSDRHCLDAATREFSDVVIDDFDRFTPAMVLLLSRVLTQPHLQSSMSFSHGEEDARPCPRQTHLHQLLEEMHPETVQLTAENFSGSRDRTSVRHLARQVLTDNPPSPKETSRPVVTSLEFDSFEEETRAIAALIHQRLASAKTTPPRITVFCPTKTDAAAISQTFLANGLRVNGQETDGSTPRRLLFDEPGIDALFSFLVALWSPSDTKHLYNVMRSEFVGFPALVLSRLMETHHRRASHATLTDVLTEFVDSKGLALRTIVDDTTTTTALAAAQVFQETMGECRAQCHTASVADIVQHFLTRVGHVERLLAPQTPRDARQAIALAAFLKEIEAAQRLVESVHVPLVVPYLQQLQSARVVSISDEDDQDLTGEEDLGIRVLPLTRYDLDEYQASQTQDGCDLVVLMAMRDTKFPGRLKRITWPLPVELLAEPWPIQTRGELLAETERLVYDALVQLDPQEIIVSFASGSAKKPDKLSRVLEPLRTTPVGKQHRPPSSDIKKTDTSLPPPPPPPSSAHVGYEPTHLSYSQIAEYARCPQQYYLSRVLGLRSFAEDNTPNLAMMFGSAVHEAVAAFGRRLQQGDSTAEAEQEAHGVLDQAWRRDGFLSTRQETFFFERAQSTLRAFLTRHDASAEIIAVEKIFDCVVGRNSDVVVRGVWDRVDRTPDGAIVIREFKTNPSAQRRTRSAQDAAAAESLQLQIYLVAYEQLHGETPRGATLEVLEEEDAANAVGFVAYSADLRPRVDAVVDETMQAIREGEFTAMPGFLQCAMCPYASSACRANVVETEDVV